MRHAIAIFATLLAAPAFAQQTAPPAKPAATAAQQNQGLGKHDSRAPINVSSDGFSSDIKTKEGDYIGNVIVTQGDMKLRADRMHFDVTNGSLSLITATGNVVVVAPDRSATGDHGVYDLTTHLITMTGKVVLTKEKNVMRGTKLVMDMTTNLAHLTAEGAQGGRVQALFIPPPQKAGAGTGATPAKPPNSTGK
jgi:lipopolysaccharide export system protein LptA